MSSTRRRLGIALAAGGALLLTAAGGVYARGALARERARTAWEIERARAVRLGADGALVAASISGVPREGAPIARLRIPRLGLDEIVVHGVGDDELNVGPGHLPASVPPGDAGNAVISAHRDRHFSRLDELRLGDTITTETARGATVWVVTGRKVVHRSARALVDRGETELTLTTCWPVRHFGPAPERLIVTARPVSGPADGRVADRATPAPASSPARPGA